MRDPGLVVEAIAEFYTLEIMHRSGTLSARHYRRSHDRLEQWSSEVEGLEADESSGPRTARGVAILRQLDLELREISDDRISLDDVARQLAVSGMPVSTERLRRVATEFAGQPLDSLSPQVLNSE